MDPKFFRQYLDILSERTVINPETGEIQPTLAQTITGPAATQNQMDQAEERQRADLGLPSLASKQEADYQRRLGAYRQGDNRAAGFGFKPRPGDELKETDILDEFGADNGPIGVAGRQPAPAAPAAQPQQQGVSRFANTADAYDSGINGPAGQRTTINTSTGQKQTSDASGTATVDASGTPISHTTPTLGGYQQTTYTGSAGKGPASGAQTTSYDTGPMQVTKDTNAAGKQTASSLNYDMGIAKASATQQGDENAPVQTSMQYVQPDGSYGNNPPVQEEDEELQRLKEFLAKPY